MTRTGQTPRWSSIKRNLISAVPRRGLLFPEKHLRRGGFLLEEKAEAFSAAPKIHQDAGSVSFLVIRGAWIRVVHAVAQRIVEQYGDFSGGGGDSLGFADPRR